jgi:hypothetical protein
MLDLRSFGRYAEVIGNYRHFGTTYRSHLQILRSKMGRTDYPKTSVTTTQRCVGLASHRGGPDAIPGQCMWDLWWTKWPWARWGGGGGAARRGAPGGGGGGGPGGGGWGAPRGGGGGGGAGGGGRSGTPLLVCWEGTQGRSFRAARVQSDSGYADPQD